MTRCSLIAAALCLSIAQANAEQFTEAQIRRDCTRDALRYCTAESWSCLKRETPECRSAVIACMLENIGKLRPQCRQHFY